VPTVTQEEIYQELVETIQSEMNELNLSGIPGATTLQRAMSQLRGGKPAKIKDTAPVIYHRPGAKSTEKPGGTPVGEPPTDTPPTTGPSTGSEDKAIPILKGKRGVSLQSFVDKMGGTDPEIKGVVRSTILKHVAQQLTKQGVKIMEEEHVNQAHQMIAEEFINFLDEANVAIYNHPDGKEHSLNGALQQLRSGGATGIEKEKLGKLLNAITRWAKSHSLKVTEEIENNIVRMLDERALEATRIIEQARWKELSGIT
tara:strand:+ start:3339 stop:4109 length:771 start_codon:yes stop_codon:yes gene_type:complete